MTTDHNYNPRGFCVYCEKHRDYNELHDLEPCPKRIEHQDEPDYVMVEPTSPPLIGGLEEG